MGMALGTKKPASDINVTPLIDVVLVLLIIFMVLTPLAEKQKFMRVPDYQPEMQPVPPDTVPPDQTILTALRNGNVLLNRQEMSVADAMQRLHVAYDGRPSKVLFFNAEDARQVRPGRLRARPGARRGREHHRDDDRSAAHRAGRARRRRRRSSGPRTEREGPAPAGLFFGRLDRDRVAAHPEPFDFAAFGRRQDRLRTAAGGAESRDDPDLFALPEPREHRLEVGRQRARRLDARAIGSFEREPGGVQELSAQTGQRRRRPTVERVAGDGVAEVREVRPDLVHDAGDDPDPEQRVRLEAARASPSASRPAAAGAPSPGAAPPSPDPGPGSPCRRAARAARTRRRPTPLALPRARGRPSPPRAPRSGRAAHPTPLDLARTGRSRSSRRRAAGPPRPRAAPERHPRTRGSAWRPRSRASRPLRAPAGGPPRPRACRPR